MSGRDGNGPKRSPHRIVDLTSLVTSLPDPDASPRGRAKTPRVELDKMYANYAAEFTASCAYFSSDYLRWPASFTVTVTPAIKRSTETLNAMIDEVLGEYRGGVGRIEPDQVLSYIVRHWGILRANISMRLGPFPFPDQIARLCRRCAGEMDVVLLGIFGKRLQQHLEARQRQICGTNGPDDERITLLYSQWRRLLASVPYLRDEGFLDSLDGVMFGRQLQ